MCHGPDWCGVSNKVGLKEPLSEIWGFTAEYNKAKGPDAPVSNGDRKVDRFGERENAVFVFVRYITSEDDANKGFPNGYQCVFGVDAVNYPAILCFRCPVGVLGEKELVKKSRTWESTRDSIPYRSTSASRKRKGSTAMPLTRVTEG